MKTLEWSARKPTHRRLMQSFSLQFPVSVDVLFWNLRLKLGCFCLSDLNAVQRTNNFDVTLCRRERQSVSIRTSRDSSSPEGGDISLRCSSGLWPRSSAALCLHHAHLCGFRFDTNETENSKQLKALKHHGGFNSLDDLFADFDEIFAS